MKIKMGFVTNSSSTSFIAWGMQYETFELKELFGELLYEKEKESGECEYNTLEEFLDNCDIEDDIYYLCKKVGLDCRSWYDADMTYIGISPFDMKNNQTLDEYKIDIAEKFNKLGITDIDKDSLIQIEECWYNG